MTSFVHLTEYDPAYNLATILNTITNPPTKEQKELNGDELLKKTKTSKLGQLVTNKKYTELIEKHLFGSFDKLFKSNPQDIDSCFSLAFSLLPKIGKVDEDKINDIVCRFATQLGSIQFKEHAKLRLKLLSILFNLLEVSSPLRHDILVSMLQFSIHNKMSSVFLGQLDNVDKWIEQWDLEADEVSLLYVLTSKVFEEAGEMEKSRSFLFRYLKTFEKAKPQVLEQALPHAERAIVDALKNPKQFRFDHFLSLKAVQALSKNKKYSDVYKLCEIFTKQPLSVYTKFYKGSSGVIKKLGLDNDQLVDKLRTLTLCSMGLKKERLTYKEIQEELELKGEDEVEAAIITAVMTTHLEAKIDDTAQKVIIQRTMRRNFTMEHWTELQDRLYLWTSNIGDIMNSLHRVQHRVQAMSSE